MKRINCFIPYGKIEATRQTVAQLAESSLVSQIYLITDDPHAKAIYPCNLIRTENIWSTKTLREIAGYASAHYTLIYTKTEELQLGMYALERLSPSPTIRDPVWFTPIITRRRRANSTPIR